MSTTVATMPHASAGPSSRGALSSAQIDGDRTPTAVRHVRAPSPKPRSSSEAPKPTLSPSPAFREPAPRMSKDDSAVINPTTPRRTVVRHTRGLSLQMPPKDGPVTPTFSTSRGPVSPRQDVAYPYGSPTSMVPRRSRGLDFSRAATNLHHSTLAASSPEASPTIGGKGIQIPQRRSLGNSILDSPSNMSSSLWSTMHSEKTGLSSSVSSVNMLDSNSDSDSDSDDMAIDADIDDPMLTTPGITKLNSNLLGTIWSSPGGEPLAAYTSPGQSNLHNFTRARLRANNKKSRHSSSSTSLHSAKPSPGPLSPRLIQSIETNNAGYFNSNLSRQQVQSRRESLSLGTDLLHLSDSEDNDRRPNLIQPSTMDPLATLSTENSRGVVRRAVTRRSNMLPKPKTFARIRAALLEESSPVDTDLRREAEVIRQVHENDPAPSSDPSPTISSTPFTQEPETSPDESSNDQSALPTNNFGQHAERNSAGLGFWHAFDERYRTPPPSLKPRESTSNLSDEAMDTLAYNSVFPTIEHAAFMHLNRSRSRSRSTTPMPANPPTAGDVARKVNNKRRRDEEFDPAAMKRRAVSPGLSVQSSPVLPQSPVLTSDKGWGRPPAKQQDRSNSGGSIGNGMKKVGLQGMTETNDSLMNMSID